MKTMHPTYLFHFVARRRDDHYKHIHFSVEVTRKMSDSIYKSMEDLAKEQSIYRQFEIDHIIALVGYQTL